jgi:hypothetical protein
MKNSIDIIGNRSRDLPVRSLVPKPLRHRVPYITKFTAVILGPLQNAVRGRCFMDDDNLKHGVREER